MNLTNLTKPKLSILVSIYNVGEYLRKCLLSIVNQKYPNLEILLVDSNSTDQSSKICLEFLNTDKRIKYYKIQNKGLVASRKFALMKCKGDYVAYVDGDDWIEKNFSELMMEKILSLDVDLVVSGFFKDLLEKNYIIEPYFPEKFFLKEDLNKEIYPFMIFNGNFFEHGISTYLWGKVFRKNLLLSFQKAVPNEILIGEDSSVVYPYILNSNSIYILHKPLYHYVQRYDSILKSSFEDDEEILKIKILKSHLKKAFVLERVNNFQHQIEKYIQSLFIIRTGGLLKENNHIISFFDKNFINRSVVIYSSGSFGVILKKKIEKLNLASIVGWIDEDFNQNTKMNLKVLPLEQIKFIDFDYIIIASINFKSIHENISKFLKLGILPNKIVLIDAGKCYNIKNYTDN